MAIGHEGTAMHGLVTDIEADTEDNTDFRRVLYSGHNLQLVLMALAPGEDIGEEVHQTHDQFFRIEKGRGSFFIDGETTAIKSGWGMVVPAGARHNVTNTGDKPMRLYTIYAPPQHQDRIVKITKAAAEAEPEHFDGKTSE
jgi:mannose-6-phosphate isomerase-like protein (cupin superfamily)